MYKPFDLVIGDRVFRTSKSAPFAVEDAHVVTSGGDVIAFFDVAFSRIAGPEESLGEAIMRQPIFRNAVVSIDSVKEGVYNVYGVPFEFAQTIKARFGTMVSYHAVLREQTGRGTTVFIDELSAEPETETVVLVSIFKDDTELVFHKAVRTGERLIHDIVRGIRATIRAEEFKVFSNSKVISEGLLAVSGISSEPLEVKRGVDPDETSLFLFPEEIIKKQSRAVIRKFARVFAGALIVFLFSAGLGGFAYYKKLNAIKKYEGATKEVDYLIESLKRDPKYLPESQVISREKILRVMEVLDSLPEKVSVKRLNSVAGEGLEIEVGVEKPIEIEAIKNLFLSLPGQPEIDYKVENGVEVRIKWKTF